MAAPGVLQVEGTNPTTFLQVFDLAGQEVAEGTHRLTKQLPPGVYRVRASGPGYQKEALVRLTAGAHKPLPLEPPQLDSPAPLETVRSHHEYHRYPAEEMSRGSPHLRYQNGGGRLFLFARTSGEERSAIPSFRLRTTKGAEVANFPEVGRHDLQHGWLCLTAELPGGMYCIEEALPEEAGGGRRGQAVFVEEGWETQVFVPWEKDQPQFAWAVIFLRPLGEGFQGHKDKAAAYLETEAALLGLAQGRLVLAPDQQADLPQIAHTDPIRGLAASYALLRQGNFARLQAIGEVLQGLLPHSPDARLLAWLAASGGRLEWQQRHPETFQNPFLFAAGMEAFVRAAGRINVACPWNSRLGEIALLRTTGSVWVRWEEPITPPTLDRALQQLYGQIRENAPSPWSSSESLATYLGLPVSVIAEARRRVEGIFEEVRQSSEFERLIRERHRQWPHLWNLEECQEAIIDHIWKKLDQFEGKEKPQFLAWVRRLSWSVGVDRQRSVQAEKRARTGWADWLPRWVRPASEVVETKDLVERLLSGLNQRERQLVQLVYYDGLSFDKVAVALKTTKPALYQLHYRLLQKLRERAEALKTDR